MSSAHQKTKMAAILFRRGAMVGGQVTNVGKVWKMPDQWVHISKIDPQQEPQPQ